MLYALWIIYFIIRSLCLLILFIRFAQFWDLAYVFLILKNIKNNIWYIKLPQAEFEQSWVSVWLMS